MTIYRADGTEYKKVVTKDENTTAHMTAKGGYTGLENATGGYFRTPSSGLIPNVSGGSGYVGTSNWPFLAGYFNELYVSGVRQNFRYSTSEQWTGRYWIDGKKIYTLTLNINTEKIDVAITYKHNIKNVKLMWIDHGESYLIQGGSTGVVTQPVNWSYIGYTNSCYVADNFGIIYRMHWSGLIVLQVFYTCTNR